MFQGLRLRCGSRAACLAILVLGVQFGLPEAKYISPNLDRGQGEAFERDLQANTKRIEEFSNTSKGVLKDAITLQGADEDDLLAVNVANNMSQSHTNIQDISRVGDTGASLLEQQHLGDAGATKMATGAAPSANVPLGFKTLAAGAANAWQGAKDAWNVVIVQDSKKRKSTRKLIANMANNAGIAWEKAKSASDENFSSRLRSAISASTAVERRAARFHKEGVGTSVATDVATNKAVTYTSTATVAGLEDAKYDHEPVETKGSHQGSTKKKKKSRQAPSTKDNNKFNPDSDDEEGEEIDEVDAEDEMMKAEKEKAAAKKVNKAARKYLAEKKKKKETAAAEKAETKAKEEAAAKKAEKAAAKKAKKQAANEKKKAKKVADVKADEKPAATKEKKKPGQKALNAMLVVGLAAALGGAPGLQQQAKTLLSSVAPNEPMAEAKKTELKDFAKVVVDSMKKDGQNSDQGASIPDFMEIFKPSTAEKLITEMKDNPGALSDKELGKLRLPFEGVYYKDKLRNKGIQDDATIKDKEARAWWRNVWDKLSGGVNMEDQVRNKHIQSAASEKDHDAGNSLRNYFGRK